MVVYIRDWLRQSLLFCLMALLLAGTAQAQSVEALTLEQRVAQMFIVNIYGSQLTQTGREFLTRYQPGGLVLLPDNIVTPEQITSLTNSYQQTMLEVGGFPLFIAVDQEMGPIARLRDGFTIFPTPSLLTATGEPEMAYWVGEALARELIAVGINMNLAPVADLETNPQNPIITRRSFGSDPAQVSPMLGAFVQGTQAAGVLATAKHFPGHGDSAEDSHTTLPVIDLSRERLQAVELAPFRAAIEAEIAAIMVAHIWYPALDEQADRPASLSPRVIQDVLRGEMGYQGLVVTDALDMDAIDTVYSYPEAVVAAISAGADLVLTAHMSLESQVAAIQAVVTAVENGTLDEAQINASVQRILDTKARFGLLNWQPLDPAGAVARIDLESHAALVDELFLKGVTVAVDRNGWIPLNPEGNTLLIYPATRIQIMNECRIHAPAVKGLGVSEAPTSEEIEWARVAAQQADQVVVFTQNAVDSPAQQALVRALPPEKVIAVALWSPYDWDVFPDVAAYLLTYSPLRPAVPAACAVLFGASPALGQLSLTLDNLP